MAAGLLVPFRRQIAAQAARSTSQLTGQWDRLGSYDEADIARLATQAAPIVTATKAAAVSTSAAFYATELGTPPTGVPVGEVATDLDLRAPFTSVWHALAERRPYDEAVVAGRSVLEASIRDFVTSTSRRTGDMVASRSGIAVQWVRVAEPGCCDWCSARDGGIYPSAEAGDYGHNRCACDMIPDTLANPKRGETRLQRMERANRENKARIRREIRTAKGRQDRARAEQRTERDPERLERLSTREQEWETTVERLTEQLARI